MRKLLVVVLTVLVVGLSHGGYVQLAERMLPTAVTIALPDGGGGSGVFIKHDNKIFILTAAHLFDGENKDAVVWVYPDVFAVRAIAIKVDEKKDLALLQTKVPLLDGIVPYAPIAKGVRIGEDVMCIGSPLKYGWSVTAGIVSHTNRENTRVTGVLQSDTAANPGNSGGPLFNMDGELVGIASMITTDGGLFNGISLFVNLRMIKKFLKEVK